MSIEEWVLGEIKKAGLNTKDVSCLIRNESAWKEDSSYVNADHTIDRGIFMFNNKWHAEVSSKCAYDFKCATREFIRVAKANGNFNQWHGFTKNCQ